MLQKYLRVLPIIMAMLCVGVLSSNSEAYLSNIQIVDKKDIGKISDEALTEKYLDVVIELDAIVVSHMVFVFSPKEYQQYKDLLRYRYELKSELQRRQLEIPVIEPTTH